MCSIVGYVGSHESIAYIFEGLRRLEYRGYDSAGCAGVSNDALHTCKQVGGVDELLSAWHQAPFDTSTCIGHTRWATHGGATYTNAHPHTDAHNTVAIVHNGIIENEREIRQQLSQHGYTFSSTTDSELIAHLCALYVQQFHSMQEALRAVMQRLEGAYAICAVTCHDPHAVYVARSGSPLCIGVGSACHMIASDVAGCAVAADRVVYMPEQSYARVSHDTLSLYDRDGHTISYDTHPIDYTFIASDKGSYSHYMLKEMYEQKQVVRDTVSWFQTHQHDLHAYLGVGVDSIREWTSVTMAACGTSYFAGVIGSYYMNMIAGIPSYAWIASEFRYRPHFLTASDAFMVLSQSGETADTREAMRYVHTHGVHTIGLINVPASSIEREADGHIYTHAKQEVSVASTKSFTAQISVMYWLAHYIGYAQGTCSKDDLEAAYHDSVRVAEYAESRLSALTPYMYDTVAPRYASSDYVIFLGKQIMYPLAQEAALKLQELAYIPSYAYPAGELKHGPLALIRSGTPVVLFSSPDPKLYRKILSSAREVYARGARLIVFAFEGQDELIACADTVCTFPYVTSYSAPLLMTPTMQAFAYYIARHLSCPIDKPRNLAKSVTVE